MVRPWYCASASPAATTTLELIRPTSALVSSRLDPAERLMPLWSNLKVPLRDRVLPPLETDSISWTSLSHWFQELPVMTIFWPADQDTASSRVISLAPALAGSILDHLLPASRPWMEILPPLMAERILPPSVHAWMGWKGSALVP